jgi:hypothetical protein
MFGPLLPVLYWESVEFQGKVRVFSDEMLEAYGYETVSREAFNKIKAEGVYKDRPYDVEEHSFGYVEEDGLDY